MRRLPRSPSVAPPTGRRTVVCPISRAQSRRLTVPEFSALKGQRKISMLTAYDYPMAQLLDECRVDSILVGDSLSMVVQGHENTLAGDAGRNDLPRRNGRTGGAARAGRRRLAVSQLPLGRLQGGRERRPDPQTHALPGRQAGGRRGTGRGDRRPGRRGHPRHGACGAAAAECAPTGRLQGATRPRATAGGRPGRRRRRRVRHRAGVHSGDPGGGDHRRVCRFPPSASGRGSNATARSWSCKTCWA